MHYSYHHSDCRLIFSLMSIDPVEGIEPLQYGEQYVACVSVSYQYYYTDVPSVSLNQTINYSYEDCER